MDDVTLSNFSYRKPVKNREEIVLQAAETQTIENSRKDAETMANFQQEKEIQTDEIDKGKADAGNEFRMSKEVLNLLLEFIHDVSNVNYDRLLEFHKFDKVALETVHSYHIETRNETIVSMFSNSSRKTLILFGGSSHETFCSHQARAMFCSSSTTSSLPLPVCSLSAAFSSSTQFVLGDISGTISMCTKEQKIFEVKVSEGAITCLELTKHGLMTSSDDGNIQLWQVMKGSFEKIGAIRLSVSDLPRKIRKSSTSNKPVAVVSFQVSGDECCAATETGGIYIIQLPSLDYKPISNSATSIKNILYHSPFIAIVYHSSNTVIITPEKSIEQIPIISSLAIKCGRYFVFSDHHRLLLWSCENRAICVDMSIECQAMSSFSSDTIQILDNSNNLISYFINDKI